MLWGWGQGALGAQVGIRASFAGCRGQSRQLLSEAVRGGQGHSRAVRWGSAAFSPPPRSPCLRPVRCVLPIGTRAPHPGQGCSPVRAAPSLHKSTEAAVPTETRRREGTAGGAVRFIPGPRPASRPPGGAADPWTLRSGGGHPVPRPPHAREQRLRVALRGARLDWTLAKGGPGERRPGQPGPWAFWAGVSVLPGLLL